MSFWDKFKCWDLAPKLTDSDGRKSVSFTMLVVTFFVVTLWLVLYIFQSVTGFSVPEFRTGEVMAYFGPIMTLYFFRRWARQNEV